MTDIRNTLNGIYLKEALAVEFHEQCQRLNISKSAMIALAWNIARLEIFQIQPEDYSADG